MQTMCSTDSHLRTNVDIELHYNWYYYSAWYGKSVSMETDDIVMKNFDVVPAVNYCDVIINGLFFGSRLY